VIDWMNRNEWTDAPPCVHPAFYSLAITINDYSDDAGRQRLLDIAPRLMGTASDDQVLATRLAVFAVRKAIHLVEPEWAETAWKALAAAEAYANDPSPDAQMAAYSAAWHVPHPLNVMSNNPSDWAVMAALRAAATAGGDTGEGPQAVSYAAAAVSNTVPDLIPKRWNFLVEMLDEYDRLTGRTETPELDFEAVCAMLEEAMAVS
jgi:hypothetical protein